MNIRAKITCSSIVKTSGQEIVSFCAVTSGDSEENKTYSKYTPNLGLNMTITNDNVLGAFVPGENYYLHFTPASSPNQPPIDNAHVAPGSERFAEHSV